MTARKIKVLIVDDEEGIVDYMQKILKLKGYDAFVALESDSALNLFIEERPEICVLDVHLNYSQLDGVQILAEMKKINPQVECIMVTRITDEAKFCEAEKLGAVEYLRKPVDTKEVLELINKLAQQIRAEDPSRG